MTFDPRELEPLAGALLKAGAPILGGIIGGPFGAIIGALLPQVASVFGLPLDAPPVAVAAAVAADPQAADKLSGLEEAHKDALASAQLQVDQNGAELSMPGTALQRVFWGGWRPAMGWIAGPLVLAYQIAAATMGGRLIPIEVFGPTMALWTALAGLRTSEKWQGVAATMMPPAVLKKRAR